MATYTRRNYTGTADDPNKKTYHYQIDIPAGENVFVTWEWLADWDTPVWQASGQGANSRLKVFGTARDRPTTAADWVVHDSHGDVNIPNTGPAMGTYEPDPARHFEFRAEGGGVTLNILTAQQLILTSGATVSAGLSAAGITLPGHDDGHANGLTIPSG